MRIPLCLGIILVLLEGCTSLPTWADPALTLRIENRIGGAIQARVNPSDTWRTIGRVTTPATATVPTFAASKYTPPSSVAAIATHGLRIRDGSRGETPRGFSIQPREFERPPTGYGGHVPGASGIYTDIRAGESIFRELSPLVGDAVLLERGGELITLPPDWKPSTGDIIQIHRRGRTRPPNRIEFENHTDGRVEAYFPDGTSRLIAHVIRPVAGVGRFDATGYTGPAAVNTNHPGVITISTAPASRPVDEGLPPETRGGFQIQPSRHAATQYPMPQAMVVAPVEGEEPLEGRWPLFSGALGLGDGNRIAWWKDPGGKRKELAEITGKADDALQDSVAGRWILVLDTRPPGSQVIADWIQRAAAKYAAGKEAERTAIKTVTWRPSEPVPANAAFAVFRQRGEVLMAGNQRPFTLQIKSGSAGDDLTVEFLSSAGTLVETRKARIEASESGLRVRED